MLSRLLALSMWAAVAISATFWGLRWFARPQPLPPGTVQVAAQIPVRGDITRLLSGPAAPNAAEAPPSDVAQLAARLQLVGVVAPRVALIGVDGKPPRAFALGEPVDGALVLQSMSTRGVGIGPSGGPEFLNLPLAGLPPPATGTLPSLVGTANPTPSSGLTGSASPGSVPYAPPPMVSPDAAPAVTPSRRRLLVPGNRAVPSPVQGISTTSVDLPAVSDATN